MDRDRQYLQDVQWLLGEIPVEHFTYAVNISLKNKFTYVETAKVACSTIKLSLMALEIEIDDPKIVGGQNLGEMHDRAFSPLLTPRQVGSFTRLLERKDFIKFCFARNPYTRALSAYMDKILRNEMQKKPIADMLGRPLETPVTFEEFLGCIARQPVREMDGHWVPQYDQTLRGKIAYDFIGSFEHIDADLIEIGTRISPLFPRYAQSETRHRTGAADFVAQYYTEEATQLVRRIYADDFRYFGYSPALADAARPATQRAGHLPEGAKPC
ncbi:MAG TPA: sulfotransferase family protein [Alphaproteobacteria bacterium]|nr:sulfotransferase family protein [Alphaproteobacteria bacterium]